VLHPFLDLGQKRIDLAFSALHFAGNGQLARLALGHPGGHGVM